MRRTLLAVTAVAVAALTLSGCAASDSGSGSGSDGSDAAAGLGGTFPATVDTNFGEITVDEEPIRIVALGWGDAEAVLALGAQPVGASDWLGFGGSGVGPWAEDLYDEAPEIIETLEPDYEAIGNLNPDIIFDTKGSGDQERYDRLSSIATTIGIPEGGDNYLTSTEEQMALISAALGVPDKGQELLDDVQTKYDEVKSANPDFEGKTATVAAYTSEGWGAYIDGDTRLAFLQSIGFVQNPTIEALTPDGFSVPISSEELNQLDADLLVAFPIFIEASTITDQALFNAIPAVASGHSIVIEDQLISNAFSIGSVLGTQYLIDEFVPQIADAVAA